MPEQALPKEAWRIRSSRYVIQRPWLTVRTNEVELPNGHVIPEYYTFEYPNWVNVLPVTKDGHYLLLRQYRLGVQLVTWEIPAGVIEPSDPSPLAGAQRELEEETGYGGGTWEELMVVSPNAASYSNLTYCYLAKGVERITDPHLDGGEDLRCELVTKSQLRAILERGEIVQSLMVAPLWKYFATQQ